MYFKQRAVTEFLVTEVESVTNIRKRLKNAHVVNAVDISNEGRWASRIADSEIGQAEFSDARRSGRPTTVVAQTLLHSRDELVQNDRRMTIINLATELSASKGSANNIIDALRYSNVCARCVPRSLTDYHKTVQKELRSDLLSRFTRLMVKDFSSRIVTGDET